MFPYKDKSKVRLTKIYGVLDSRYGSGKHDGIDVVSDGDKTVSAIRAGKSIRSGWNRKWGNYIVIQQDDGLYCIYAHFKERYIKVGVYVAEGQAIGYEGSTGNSSGSHLHIELQQKYYDPGTTVNIAEYLGIKNEVGPVEETKITIRKEGETYEGTLINGVLNGPVRALFESQGQEVIWNEATKTATITTGPLEKLREVKQIVEGVK